MAEQQVSTPPSSFSSQSISDLVTHHRALLDLSPFESLYKHLHAHPELSDQEFETAATVTAHLRALSPDLTIRTGIGGHGVAAVFDNNSKDDGPVKDGPTVLLRADMDALPIKEQTGLPYASTKTMRSSGAGDEAVDQPIMHACGHDMHMTSLLAAASVLIACRDKWRGTLVLVFQPAEERGSGARAMVDGGLYDAPAPALASSESESQSEFVQIPVPDVVLGGHVVPSRAGALGTRRGIIATSADSLRVTLKGRGAHASMPHAAVDPVVMAAHTVLRLQGIVSRETDPADSAVVTVAGIEAPKGGKGGAENVIPDEVLLKVDCRAVEQGTRDRVNRRVREVCCAESWAAWGGGGGFGEEEKKAAWEPDFEVTRSFPLTVNDDRVTERLEESFLKHFGGSGSGGDVEEGFRYDPNVPRIGGSEDFSILATAVGKPYCFFLYGGTDPALYDEAVRKGRLNEDVPINHSAKFAPVLMPTLRVGLEAYVVAALTFLDRV